jgi:hypothetical protein
MFSSVSDRRQAKHFSGIP